MKWSVFLLFLVTSQLSPCLSDKSDLSDVEARATKGDAEAELDLGRAYQLGQGEPQDFAKAAVLYRQAAVQGNARAMHNLGYIYLHGQGVAKNGPVAAQWFTKAANLGLPASELQLGLFYYFGDMGINQDYAMAAKWLRMAAQPQNAPIQRAPAANALGAIYEHGLGVPIDGKQAVDWYTQGAELGNAKAQANLGRVYAEGNLIQKDPIQAYMWLKLASLRGEPMATHLLPEYLAGKEFTPAQMAEGDRLVKEKSKPSPKSLPSSSN